MTYSVVDAIDAVIADLQAQRNALGLPVFSVSAYTAPLFENAEMMKPLLAVYAWGSDESVLATDGSYVLPDIIRVGWFEPVPESLEQLFVDPAKARKAILNAERVRNRIASYFANIPGYQPQTECTIVKCRFGKVRGGVYGVELDVKVTTYGILGAY